LRILLASDDPLARSGLLALLAGLPDVEVSGHASLGDDWLARAREEDADAIVADLGTADTGAESFPSLGPGEVPALVLVTDEAQGRAALLAGARGVLLRDADPDRLHSALQAVVRGLIVVDDATAAPLRPRAPAPLPTSETLTPREMEALQLLSEGLSNRQIGERLGIGERTAKFHVNSILAKLGALTRTEAVVLAVRLGLVIL
jgi:two-component system nitrate/nitrite response regulator NarL